jgi:hypothetical protein
MLNKKPEQPISNNFQNQFSEAENKLEQKIKIKMVSGLSLNIRDGRWCKKYTSGTFLAVI